MNTKYINHIRERVRNSEEHFEDFYTLTDSAIERIMTTTFVFLKTRSKKCLWYRIHSRLKNDLNKHRRAKKNHISIMILACESALAERIDFMIPADMERKIIFESARLFELIEIEREMNG